MRAVGLAIVLMVISAGAARAINCLPGYVSIDCPPTGSGSASPYPPAQVNAAQSESYRQGIGDWRGLREWFDSEIGDRRAGADWWAANRSVTNHRSCAQAADDWSADRAAFAIGCEEAKRRLDPIDARRRDPQYRAGFSDEAKRLPIAAATATGSRPASTGTPQSAPTSDAANDAAACNDHRQRLRTEAEAAQAELNYLQNFRVPPPMVVGARTNVLQTTELNRRKDDLIARVNAINAEIQQEADCIVARQTTRQAERGRQTLMALGYKVISVEDFKLDGNDLAASATRVAVSGYYHFLTQNAEFLYSAKNVADNSPDDGIFLLTDGASRATRAAFLNCRQTGRGDLIGACPVKITGHATICRKLLISELQYPCLDVEDLVSAVLNANANANAKTEADQRWVSPTYKAGTAISDTIKLESQQKGGK
jgi:hypothetical protein